MFVSAKVGKNINEYKRFKNEMKTSQDMSEINDLRRAEEKNKRETVEYFTYEIRRVKLQIEKLSKTGNLKDKLTIRNYTERILPDLERRRAAKFSKAEIARAEADFDKSYTLVDGFYMHVR